jgi:hypothetical protein
MNAAKCPDCGEGFDEKELRWVTNAEGGIMYRLPCDHIVVGTWKEGVVTYGPEHASAGRDQARHDHHHHHFWDNVDKIVAEKAREK